MNTPLYLEDTTYIFLIFEFSTFTLIWGSHEPIIGTI